MTEHRNNKGRIIFSVVLIVFCSMLLALCYSLYPDKADSSGPYLDSAHGNTSYGVDRRTIDGVNLFPDYAIGNCAPCHEQHASVGGITTTPSKYVLFYDNYVSQTDAFCFKCHDNTTTYATTAIVNRSYSYRAGGWNSDTLNDILEAFTNPPSISSHNLGDITTFITGNWGYTADSNPCAACHNPHMALGDPANSPSSAKSSGTRGYSPVSRPSLHSKDNNAWGLWGDVAAERMNTYANSLGGIYRSPFFSGGITYEPEGSATQDGSNLTDFDTFCIDCHNNTNNISSTPLGRTLYKFNWATNEMHGGGIATDNVAIAEMNAPYQDALLGSYVLACTDCHEPHGSPNNYLVRREVNNGTVIVTQNGIGNSGKEWLFFCAKCHDNLDGGSHVHPPVLPWRTGPCYSQDCHMWGGLTYRPCNNCHYHGNSSIDGNPWGKPLF